MNAHLRILAALRVSPLLLAAVLLVAGGVVPAGLTTPAAAGEAAMQHAQKHLDPSFVCPMHPQVASDEPGDCPICGMDLVERKTGAHREMTLEHAERHMDPAYVCPMHPSVVSAEPGDCPICGMDLVRRAREEGPPEAPVVQISASVVNQLGVRTVRVVLGDIARRIETVGYVSEPLAGAYYARSYTRSSSRVPVARRAGDTDTQAQAEDGPRKAAIAGEVFERHAHLLSEGQKAEFRLPHIPGRVWTGTVEWLDPEIDPTKRTFLFTMEVETGDDLLKTNMRGEVTLFAEPQTGVPIIPREALIVTGRGQRVVVALGDGRFQPRNVLTGIESGDEIAVLSGLAEGEEVVASAQFLLDSEASLQAGLRRLAAAYEADAEDHETAGEDR